MNDNNDHFVRFRCLRLPPHELYVQRGRNVSPDRVCKAMARARVLTAVVIASVYDFSLQDMRAPSKTRCQHIVCTTLYRFILRAAL